MDIHTPIERFARIQHKHREALGRLGIRTARDLLFHFPFRYETSGEAKRVKESEAGEYVTLFGTISGLKTKKALRKKIPMAEGTFTDGSGSVHLVWFNQPYIAKMIKDETPVEIRGKITEHNGAKSITNPIVEEIPELPNLPGEIPFTSTPRSILLPIYPTTRGITSEYIRYLVERVLKKDILSLVEETVPEDMLKRYNLPSLKSALVWIHTPKRMQDAEAARKRFSFEEILLIQLAKQRERNVLEKEPSFVITKHRNDVSSFMERFPFEATGAQKRAIDSILKDMASAAPMSRLLEGDVGSGKTAVAATAVYAIISTPPKENKYGALQCAYMAPTEILARQQFETFVELFSHTNLQVGLITSSGCYKYPSKLSPDKPTKISRAQLLRWVERGEIPILVGTHSLIQKAVSFKHLALVIIDEQHRFGTIQRRNLAKKGDAVPHLLSMTATPIPRTLALTIYGDLDLSLIDEMPKGRKPVKTEIVPPPQREEVYEKMRSEINDGRQAYVLCPRIDEPDPAQENALQAKSVTEESKRLKKNVFPDLHIGSLHGKMDPKEKEKVMQDFANGSIDVLVTTSVVEVGVNVQNATMIVIEGAERFGLAQLHQLRGRVVRSTHQAYCFVFTESISKKTLDRLTALKKAKNGFELAEHDLELRGAGDLFGKKQSGISDIGMEAIKNIRLVEAARTEATDLLRTDNSLASYPLLRDRLLQSEKQLHEE